jgi:hypothetical protein
MMAIPFAATGPERVLAIGSAAGPEWAAALRFSSAHVRSAAYDGNAASFAEGLAVRQDPRRELRASPGGFDLVLFSSSHTTRSAWLHANIGDDRIYTRESFADAWASLRPDGALAVVTSDERLFVRAILSAAAEDHAGIDGPIVARAWGLRVAAEARSSPYRFLLLAWKAPPPPETVQRLTDAIAVWPVEPLFGPGLPPVPPYDEIASPGDGADGREGLNRAFSRRAGRWLDLAPATDDRPVFFDITREPHPYGRWTVAVSLVPLLFVLLGPLARERRIETDAGGPPVAVRLAEFAGLGVAFSFGLAGLVHRVPFVTGVPFTRESLALAGVAAGFGFAWIPFVRRAALSSRAERTLPLAAALAIGLLAVGWETWMTFVAASGSARQLVAAAGGLAVGGAGAATLTLALRRLDKDRPAALSWSWAAFGAGAVGGVALAAWLAQLHGWSFVWFLMAALYALSAGVAWWGVRSAG